MEKTGELRWGRRWRGGVKIAHWEEMEREGKRGWGGGEMHHTNSALAR